MNTIRRAFLKLILCELEERAELLEPYISTEQEYEQWKKRYGRYVFVYGRHPKLS